MEIINRVKQSALVSFDLEEYYTPGPRVLVDLKEVLYEGLILREKDIREYLQNLDLTPYQDSVVAIICSVDAILPPWAYMLAASAFASVAKRVFIGTTTAAEEALWMETLSVVNWEQYRNAKILIRGCDRREIPPAAYAYVALRLRAVASSVMYGEACSNVPIYKKKDAPTASL